MAKVMKGSSRFAAAVSSAARADDHVPPARREPQAPLTARSANQRDLSVLGEQLAEALARGGWPASSRPDPQSIATFSSGELVAGRYRVKRLLARGGMGEVYVASDLACGRPLALKTVLSTQGDDMRAVRRLIREAGLARRIRHDNVCRVLGAGVHAPSARDVVYFMIMELLDGQSLRAWSRKSVPSIAGSVHIARQLLLGLDAVHAAGVVHGDLKSDNIVLEERAASWRAVLIDFGLSQRLDRSQRPTGKIRSGSLGYMAPEQLAGGALSVRTDIFAFGVVLCELLTGTLPSLPAPGAGQWALGALLAEGARPPPPALESLVSRCLSPVPADRFPSARCVLEALDRCGLT